MVIQTKNQKNSILLIQNIRFLSEFLKAGEGNTGTLETKLT